MPAKDEIFASLQREILSLQGFKAFSIDAPDPAGLGPINQSFPNAVFPLTAVHEFIFHSAEEGAPTGAFIAGILSTTLRKEGVFAWIGTSRFIFPPALVTFGIKPEQVIFLYVKEEKNVLWAIEEALKCKALTAVVGDTKELSFTASRRLQLAIEKSGVGCFLLRQQPNNTTTTAVARWHIKQVRSFVDDALPGVGHPHWQVNLLKVRNGKPGSWNVAWIDGKFRQVSKLAVIQTDVKKKTG